MKITAPAKLNLSLAITGEKDGYHLLDTVMEEIDLCDQITLKRSSQLEVFMSSGEECVEAAGNNTARVAAKLFFEKIGRHEGVSIHIKKKIPMQAGLGGGSSDGVAVLKGLNEMFQADLSEAELQELALGIGSDCPFFCLGGTQRARGIGEELEPVDNRLRPSYLLVKPDCGVSTAHAYAMYDVLPKTNIDTKGVIDALEAGDLEGFIRCTGNALLPAALVLEPAIAVAGEECMRLGAKFWSLTGSGSCIFAMFEDSAVMQCAFAHLHPRYPFVHICQSSQLDAERRI